MTSRRVFLPLHFFLLQMISNRRPAVVSANFKPHHPIREQPLPYSDQSEETSKSHCRTHDPNPAAYPTLFRNKTTLGLSTKTTKQLELPLMASMGNRGVKPPFGNQPRSYSAAVHRIDYYQSTFRDVAFDHPSHQENPFCSERDKWISKKPWKSMEDKNSFNLKNDSQQNCRSFKPELHLHGKSIGNQNKGEPRSNFDPKAQLCEKPCCKNSGEYTNCNDCVQKSNKFCCSPTCSMFLSRRGGLRKVPYGGGVLVSGYNNNLSKSEDFILRQALNSALKNSGQVCEHWYVMPSHLRQHLHQLITNKTEKSVAKRSKMSLSAPGKQGFNSVNSHPKVSREATIEDGAEMKVPTAQFQLLDFAEKHEKEKVHVQVTQFQKTTSGGKTELRVEKRRNCKKKALLSVYLPKIKSVSNMSSCGDENTDPPV